MNIFQEIDNNNLDDKITNLKEKEKKKKIKKIVKKTKL